jgi:DNA modification methylase
MFYPRLRGRDVPVATLETIKEAERELTRRFADRLVVNCDLDRTLVSFQANKRRSAFRWFKYKEGFSAGLVHYILRSVGIDSGKLIDPFAGSGAALFVAAKRGLDALGLELLPVGCEVIRARKTVTEATAEVAGALRGWLAASPWEASGKTPVPFAHLRITAGAFPPGTEKALGNYLMACDRVKSIPARTLLRFAALCVLEEVSYTRKDGQYLRWDYRSGRRQGARPFDKGTIPSFDLAIRHKLQQILNDVSASPDDRCTGSTIPGSVEVIDGSCLDELPRLASASFDCLITSPPYCNRYDYTRTYALELAFLGIGEERLKALRQALVSCTVENREKAGLEERFGRQTLERVFRVFSGQELLNQILDYLTERGAARLLNNTGIPRMVRNYFWEMTLVLCACARVLKPGAPLIMVNDNVRYEGAGVPVDLILSDIAQQLGYTVETIWVLPVGKGNSSQQMGKHGRDELRKCVYVWRAPTGAGQCLCEKGVRNCNFRVPDTFFDFFAQALRRRPRGAPRRR